MRHRWQMAYMRIGEYQNSAESAVSFDNTLPTKLLILIFFSSVSQRLQHPALRGSREMKLDMILGGNVSARGDVYRAGRYLVSHLKSSSRQHFQIKTRFASDSVQLSRRRFRIHRTTTQIVAMNTTTGTQSVSGRINELKESQRCVCVFACVFCS